MPGWSFRKNPQRPIFISARHRALFGAVGSKGVTPTGVSVEWRAVGGGLFRQVINPAFWRVGKEAPRLRRPGAKVALAAHSRIGASFTVARSNLAGEC